jgi:hypothetical protein
VNFVVHYESVVHIMNLSPLEIECAFGAGCGPWMKEWITALCTASSIPAASALRSKE